MQVLQLKDTPDKLWDNLTAARTFSITQKKQSSVRNYEFILHVIATETEVTLRISLTLKSFKD